jgi:hypothetical protein
MKNMTAFILVVAFSFMLTACNAESTGNKLSSQQTISISSMQIVSGEYINEYLSLYIYKNDDGKLGLINKEGNIVLEAKWKDIILVNSDRFLVQNFDSGLYGIIDNKENILCDFIYGKIEIINDEILIGYQNQNKEIFILNQNGVKYNDKAFDYVKFNGQNEFLAKLKGVDYSLEIVNYKLKINNIIQFKKIYKNETMVIHTPSDNKIDNNQVELLLADKTIEFITSMVSNDINKQKSMEVKNLTSIQNRIVNKKISSVLQIIVMKNVEPNADYTTAAYVFFTDNVEIKIEIYINFIKAENGDYLVNGLDYD